MTALICNVKQFTYHLFFLSLSLSLAKLFGLQFDVDFIEAPQFISQINDAEWLHLVLVMYGPRYEIGVGIFVNGQSKSQYLPATQPTKTYGSSAQLTLAASDLDRLDELFFWNRRLSYEEVQMLYNSYP